MNFFNFLKIVSKHRREVLNGPRVFLEHQRDVLDRKQHAKTIFQNMVFDFKTPLRALHFGLGSSETSEMLQKRAF